MKETLSQSQISFRKSELLCNNNMVGLTLQQKEIRLDFYRVSFVILANNMINIEWMVKASFMLRLAQINVTDYPASLFWQKFLCLLGSFIQSLTCKGVDPRQKETVVEAFEAFAVHCPFLWTTSFNFTFKEIKVYSPSYCRRSSWAPVRAHRCLTCDYSNFGDCSLLRVIHFFLKLFSCSALPVNYQIILDRG